jgi:glutathione S-transferase
MKLSYFPIEGRGEAIRLALHIGEIPFEDHRIPFPEWPGVKGTTPWGSIPILEVDGKTIAQSNTILRFGNQKQPQHVSNNSSQWVAVPDSILRMNSRLHKSTSCSMLPKISARASQQRLAHQTLRQRGRPCMILFDSTWARFKRGSPSTVEGI